MLTLEKYASYHFTLEEIKSKLEEMEIHMDVGRFGC